MKTIRFYILSFFVGFFIFPCLSNSQDSVPIQNKNKKVIGQINKDEALKLKLFYSPEDRAFYSEKVSQEIKENIKQGNLNRDSFYGDQVLNQYIQPNYISTNYSIPGQFNLHYYGSGDADDDGCVNFDDHTAMVTGTSNDRTDVNGDGVTNTQDADIVYDYLTDQIPVLQGHWNFNSTTNQEDWRQKMFTIDLTNQIPYVPGQFECDEFELQTLINFSGIENIANSGIDFSKIDTTQNARFNLPVYGVSTRTNTNIAHRINSILEGAPANVFEQETFIEPQNDLVQSAGGTSLNNYANIDRYCYFFNELFQQYMYANFPIIDFDLTNGNPSVSWQHPDLVINKPVEWTYINIGGQGPADIGLEYEVAFENSNPDPNVSGDITGNAEWSSRFYSDSTNRVGTTSDSTFFNYDVWRDFWAISDSSSLIDTMYMTNDSRYSCDDAQLIEIRDTQNPEITRNQTNYSMLYSDWLANGIALSTITDNCGPYWDSTHTQTNTQGAPNTCGFYNFVVTDSTYADDPSNNNVSDVFQVSVSLDPDQWDFFPEPSSIPYWTSATPTNTGGPATASNPAGTPVDVTWDTLSHQNPDPNMCEHYNYLLDMIYTKTNSVCGNSSDSTQVITKYKPNSLVCTEFPDSATISRTDPKEPWFTGEPSYSDTLEPQFPTDYEYWDELISASPTDTIWHRHFNGKEFVCYTTTPDSIQVITKDLLIGIGDNKQNGKSFLVKIYPNPATNLINISFDKEFLIEIYDNTGRMLLDSKSTTVDVSHLSKGIYILLIKDDQGVLMEREKLIVE